jgi:hypothetical protein
MSAAAVEQRRNAQLVHGAQSEPRVKDAARAQKRRLLRRLGRRASDLDAISALYVDLLSRSLAKLALLDKHYAAAGIVREDGQGQATLPLYVSMLNSARLTAARLADHMARQGEQGEDLADYIAANYTRQNGDGAADE